MTYVIAISNEKGGVAKTTTTLSLGASLVEKGASVLLLDLDPQGNLTLAAGLEPGDVEYTSSDVMLNALPLRQAIYRTNTERLDIVPANGKTEHAEDTLSSRPNFIMTLREAILQSLPLPYDYTVLDCPPALGAVTLNALTAAQLLVIPTQAEYFSAYALRDMMALIRRVRRESNPDMAYRILITMLDQRNRAHRTIREQLQQTFGTGLFTTVIEVDTRLRESPIAGMPITQYRPNSRGSQQYRDLAQELIEYVKQTNAEAA